LLEGKTVNLRVMEREDVDFRVECINDPNFLGEYDNFPKQMSKSDWLKRFDSQEPSQINFKVFIIQKKDGTKIGTVVHFNNQPSNLLEIGYAVVPSERGKGYGTEAIQLMVDYLFLSQDIIRIQASTDVRNMASQKVLEKNGFKKEGVLRKSYYARGTWTDGYVYSILREEWKEPKILTRTE